MAKEIDQFLMDKFCDGVKKERSPSKIAIYNQYPLSNKSLCNLFNDIKKSLEGIIIQTLPEEFGIREKLYCLNDLWTEFQVVSNRDQGTRINLRKKLNDMKVELKRDSVKAVNRTASKQGDGDKPSSPTQTSAVSSFGASNVYGFDDDVTSLEKVLVRPGSEDRFKAIGIMGKAGIGKTALSQLLFYKPEVKVKDYFLPRISISMSTQPGDDEEDQKVTILKRMLESLGVEKEKIINKGRHDLKGLLYALHLQLQGKRYLIVLDNASNTDKWYGQLNSSPTRVGEWDRLACGLPKGCGGAVIVTSRNEQVAEMMVGGREGERFLHQVLPLSDPESFWNIFIQAAEQESKRQYNISELTINTGILKEEILQKCAGLPLTATMMGEYQDFLIK
ncbi:probable disease resistance protein At5g45440 [Corylus avellana]|uniref:probable disease resistance protein At5g45440 n=1 Tax=Corylus avellana TaxID=13451 RepID=UPI00286D2849|nr:probable disease resistance protein At5g45440 [Corylus avellana]